LQVRERYLNCTLLLWFFFWLFWLLFFFLGGSDPFNFVLNVQFIFFFFFSERGSPTKIYKLLWSTT
jgi:hypothetical protein